MEKSRLEELRRRHRWMHHAALDAWADFPVERHPRPLVILGPAIRLNGQFCSIDAEMAFLNGAIDTHNSVPGDLRDLLRRNPHPYLGTRVNVEAATRTSAQFETDRGPATFEAWTIYARELQGQATVLDPNIVARAWWPPGRNLRTTNASTEKATLSEDRLTIHLRFDGWSDLEYGSVNVFESHSAVVLEPLVADAPGKPYARTAPDSPPIHVMNERSERRTTVAKLGTPLGARVLLTTDGLPVQVLTPKLQA